MSVRKRCECREEEVLRNESLKSSQNGEMDFWEVSTYEGENQSVMVYRVRNCKRSIFDLLNFLRVLF